MKIKCTATDWVDVSMGKVYDAHPVGSEGYGFIDDNGDEREINILWEEWEVVEETINPSDLTMNIQWRDMEFSVESLTVFHEVTEAINVLRKHLRD